MKGVYETVSSVELFSRVYETVSSVDDDMKNCKELTVERDWFECERDCCVFQNTLKGICVQGYVVP